MRWICTFSSFSFFLLSLKDLHGIGLGWEMDGSNCKRTRHDGSGRQRLINVRHRSCGSLGWEFGCVWAASDGVSVWFLLFSSSLFPGWEGLHHWSKGDRGFVCFRRLYGLHGLGMFTLGPARSIHLLYHKLLYGTRVSGILLD